jgi:predicted aspartyl protease
MQLYAIIKGAQITALVDSGSTHNFMDLDTAEHIGLKFGDRAGL